MLLHYLVIIGRFVLHQCAGALVFCTVIVPIVLLNRFVEWLIADLHDPFIRLVCHSADYFLALADLIVFIVYVTVVSMNMVRELRRE